mgnify:CR=1 FL=1
MIKIANVRLRGKDKPMTVEVKGGRISNITEYSGESGDFNGKGMLLTESFTIPHVHLDKVETGDLIESRTVSIYQLGTDASASIELAAEVKKYYDPEVIASRITGKLMKAARKGVTRLRGFIDVDSYAQLKGFEGAVKAKENVKGVLEFQIVAFPQQGLIKDREAEGLIEEALKKGADVVGGIPWIEKTEEDKREHVRIVIELAKKHGKPAALLVDDAPDPRLRTLEYLADEALKENYVGKVEACHARALEVYDKESLKRVLGKVKDAGISLVTNPHTGKFHLPVEEALRSGVNVALGQDDCNDAYYPYGQCSPLEVAFLASHLLWSMDPSGRETIYDMITWRASKAIGYESRLEVGGEADLVILRHDSVKDAIRYHDDPLYVFKKGDLIFEGI